MGTPLMTNRSHPLQILQLSTISFGRTIRPQERRASSLRKFFSMSATVGELSEIRGEMLVQWKMADFLSLSDECYDSPTFYFSAASWYLKVYPNGQGDDNSTGMIGLYLIRGDSGPKLSVTYTFCLKTADGKKVEKSQSTSVFNDKGVGCGSPEHLSRSDLLERESELAPSGVLTVVCSLRHDDPKDLGMSLFRRLHNVSVNLKRIFFQEKWTDVILHVQGRNIPAHRMILESRSPVFSGMFGHDSGGNRKNAVTIEHIDLKSFQSVLCYIYSGDIGWMSSKNVFKMFAAAEKYELKELQHLCAAFIKENLSVQWVCDVIKFADVYKDEEIARCSRKYFGDNAKKILETDHWKTFAKKNPDISIDLLSSVVKDRP